MCLYMPTKIMRFGNIKEELYDITRISKEWEKSLDLLVNLSKRITFLDVYNTYQACKVKVKEGITKDPNDCIKILKNEFIRLIRNRRYNRFLLNIVNEVCEEYNPFDISHGSEVFKLICTDDCDCIDYKVDILFLFFETNLKIEYNKSFSKESLCIYISIIERFLNIIEAKDSYTRKHSERVNLVSKKFGNYISLPVNELDELNIASILHDIGKIGISKAILTKNDKLTDFEYDTIKKHTEYGEFLAKKIPGFGGVSNIIKYHHERYDGKGYYNLPSYNITRNMYIIALCDAFDSMNSDRPYRRALSYNNIIEEYKRCVGKQFEPKLCNKFIEFLTRNSCDIQKMYG